MLFLAYWFLNTTDMHNITFLSGAMTMNSAINNKIISIDFREQLYLVFKGVDNSCIAEHHHHQRQQVSNQKFRQKHSCLSWIAPVDGPRHAGFSDDVSGHIANAGQKHRKNDPHDYECSIHQTPLDFKLQKILSYRWHTSTTVLLSRGRSMDGWMGCATSVLAAAAGRKTITAR